MFSNKDEEGVKDSTNLAGTKEPFHEKIRKLLFKKHKSVNKFFFLQFITWEGTRNKVLGSSLTIIRMIIMND